MKKLISFLAVATFLGVIGCDSMDVGQMMGPGNMKGSEKIKSFDFGKMKGLGDSTDTEKMIRPGKFKCNKDKGKFKAPGKCKVKGKIKGKGKIKAPGKCKVKGKIKGKGKIKCPGLKSLGTDTTTVPDSVVTPRG